MIRYPEIGPELLRIGPLRIRWYGVMYVLAYLIGWQILRKLARENFLRLSETRIESFLLSLFLGMLIGARGIYMLVYYVPTPDSPFVWWYTPFAIWHGGLSFHGGAIGMIFICYFYARRHSLPLLNLTDSLAIAAAPGIALGRLGNFINAELYGRPTAMPWAMRFPIYDDMGNILNYTSARHPSQLYEALGEGILLFLLLWSIRRRVKNHGTITSVALLWYGCIRFLLEFFREKDPQLPYYFGWMTMGQILCAIMILLGIGLLGYVRWRSKLTQ
ncbi:MAG: prolipoprotein diacylglyceryl transferase [Candidatus Sumerlaeaceae bacterium]|jgi:phosphatidylglycerol:prolipoprotein diacylglycerol transferase